MDELAVYVGTIKRARGSNDKLDLLGMYGNNERFKSLMHFIYNPYIRTGIAKAKLNRGGITTVDKFTVEDIIEYFTKNQTGSDKDVGVARAFIDQYTEDTPSWNLAVAMVTKNLKIGITSKSLNKVYGEDFIPMIGIMSAHEYKGTDGPFIVTEKIDGARRLLFKENGKITIYSRTGIPDYGLVDIEKDAKYLPEGAVYDGELKAIGEFADALELRQATNSIANSKGERTGLTFNIFDTVSTVDFKRGKSTHDAINRKALVAAMFSDPGLKHIVDNELESLRLPVELEFIKAVPILGVAKNFEEVMSYAEPIWQSGFEGVMLNTLDGYYEVDKRVRSVLKVKNIVEMTLPVIGVEEGKNKYTNAVGKLVVDYKGNKVGVGSGLTDKERRDWWKDPSAIIGELIEIECQGESTNKQGGTSLSCPIYKRVANGGD